MKAKRSRASLITKAQASRCTLCDRPLWSIDPERRKNKDGVPLGHESRTPKDCEGSCCWNGRACLERRLSKREENKRVIEFADKLRQEGLI